MRQRNKLRTDQIGIEAQPLEIRRILVALDASEGSLSALTIAAQLALLLGAELLGVFVEDINLVRVSQLPFAREVRYLGAAIQPLTEQKVVQRLRLQAVRAGLAFAKAIEANRIPGSFHVVQGVVTAELLAAALRADLLVMGRAGRVAVARTGSTARTMLAHAPCSVLLMQPGVNLNQIVLVIYDGSEGSRQALILAAHLAQTSRRLHVVTWASDEMEAREQEKEVALRLQSYHLDVSYRRLLKYELGSIVDIVQRTRPGIVVLGEMDCRLPAGMLQVLLEKLHRPILLVRA